MGLLHADQKTRDSFTIDVIEYLRAIIDDQSLTLLEWQVFGR